MHIPPFLRILLHHLPDSGYARCQYIYFLFGLLTMIFHSVRRVGYHLYNPLSTSQSTSIRVFLNTASFFASLPVVSGVSSTLAHKIIYRVMASVRSDYTAHVIFKVQKSFFEYPFTYYSLETPKCCSLQKNPLTNKALQRHF